MTTLERVQAWAAIPVTMDITTMILRSEGVSDAEIAAAYDATARNPLFVTDVANRMATIRRTSGE